ncbi:DUF6949 family protein [Polycladidibacter stylochi]|uniref:DUF6949 family protein n=1 Tax=Polycladidibacter stylochi TaxID=1807766 RepID=UPI0008379D53|nr:hypothetical protein [Pseudovibrio stylochi]
MSSWFILALLIASGFIFSGLVVSGFRLLHKVPLTFGKAIELEYHWALLAILLLAAGPLLFFELFVEKLRLKQRFESLLAGAVVVMWSSLVGIPSAVFLFIPLAKIG